MDVKRKVTITQLESDRILVNFTDVNSMQHLRPMLRAAEIALRTELAKVRPQVDLTVHHRQEPAIKEPPSITGECSQNVNEGVSLNGETT